MEDTVATGPVSFDDVVRAIGDSDPSETNAAKLRTIIGRGSYATIQRHLDAIRAQRARALQPAEVKTPDAPPELLSMWGAAVAVAVAQVRTRLDSVVQERDSLAQALTSSRGDTQALASELEAMAARAEAAAADAAQQITQLQNQAAEQAQAMQAMQAQAQQALQAQQEAAAQELAAVRQELVSVRHEKELERAQHAAATALLRGELDRLVNNLADLRAGLAGKLV